MRKGLKLLVFGGEGSLGDLSLDVLASFEILFPSNDLRNSLDENVDELGLRFSKTVSVRDIPSTSSRGRVDTSGTTG